MIAEGIKNNGGHGFYHARRFFTTTAFQLLTAIMDSGSVYRSLLTVYHGLICPGVLVDAIL